MRGLTFAGFLLAMLLPLHAATPFTLEGVKRLYVVVESHTKKVTPETERKLKKMMQTTLAELGVSSEDYPPEVLVLMIDEYSVGKTLLFNVALMIGEEVRRKGQTEEVFGVTYMQRDLFETEAPQEDLLESGAFLLSEFADQYREENPKTKGKQ